MAISQELEKARRFKREKAKLRRIFKPMPAGRFKAAAGLVEEAAFMAVVLTDLRALIDAEGVVTMFEQGPNRYLRQNPAAKIYCSLVQRYTTVCKLLMEALPDSDKAGAEDELMAFVKRQRR
jgi:hypothetical protein